MRRLTIVETVPARKPVIFAMSALEIGCFSRMRWRKTVWFMSRISLTPTILTSFDSRSLIVQDDNRLSGVWQESTRRCVGVPAGTLDNSPPLQRWDGKTSEQSRQGRLKVQKSQS